MSLRALVSRLAACERSWQGRTFLAPVTAPGRACLRVQGLVQQVRVEPADFSGVAVFEFTGPDRARLQRAATPSEREAYFRLWPTRRLRLLLPVGEEPAHGNELWLALAPVEPAPLRVALVPQGAPFRAVRVAWQPAVAREAPVGWYLGTSRDTPPGLEEALARHLRDATPPGRLQLAGLEPSAEQAYALAWSWRYGAPQRPQAAAARPARMTSPPLQERVRLQRALATGGGELHSYAPDERHADAWSVVWSDSLGQRHRSVVRQDNLSVLSSGICLSGRDADFDLTSLVGVMEGDETL